MHYILVDKFLAVELSCFNTSSLHTFSFSEMLFSLHKHYLDLYITERIPIFVLFHYFYISWC